MPDEAATTATVLALALKTAELGPMREVSRATAIVNGGLEGSVPPSPKRGITFLAVDAWRAALRDAGGDPERLAWYARRANVLVEGEAIGHWIGGTVRVGDAVTVEILGETLPCERMNEAQQGLLDALKPDCRGGVYGRVLAGGAINTGDAVSLRSRP